MQALNHRLQLGFSNWKNSIVIITTFNGKTYIVSVDHNVHDTFFINQIIIQELEYYKATNAYLNSPASYNRVVNIIKEIDGVILDGSCIGFGMTEGNILVTTIDGKILGTLY